MNRTGVIVALLTALTAGCGAEPGARLQVSETAQELRIARLDGTGTMDAELTIAHGRFTIPADDDRVVDGRKLDLTVGNNRFEHVSGGEARLLLPFPGGATEADFLEAPEVAAALLRWNITFDPTTRPAPVIQSQAPVPPSSGEVAYQTQCWLEYGSWETHGSATGSAGACNFATSDSCGTALCQEFTNAQGVKQEYVCCGGSKTAIDRKCTTANDPTNPCGAAGPGGCAVCWNHSYLITQLDGEDCCLLVGSPLYIQFQY